MTKVRLNKSAYSESSKKSIGFEYLGEFYEDISYWCKKCGKSTVYTAQDQKITFEVKKQYMWQQRFLCDSCYKEMTLLKNTLFEMEQYYCNNKEQALKDEVFLRKWLGLLNEYPRYWKKANHSRIIFVRKALGLV